jgi:hypothetical protein
VVEALAVGSLWHVARARRAWQLVPLAMVAYLGAQALLPGVAHAKAEADAARASRQADRSPGSPGRALLETRRAIARLARDPDIHLLTDVGLFDLYLGERATFGDPWLFRLLVRTGQVHPTKLEKLVENEYYDVIITMHGLESPSYAANVFGLPMSVVERARIHYALIGRRGGFYVYGRRDRPSARVRSLIEPAR